MNGIQSLGESRTAARVALSLSIAAALVAASLAFLAPAAGSLRAQDCTEALPTPTPSATPTESPTVTPFAGEALAAADPEERFVSLEASKSVVKIGSTVTISGVLASADGSCRPEERVDIISAALGSGAERKSGQAVTDAEGAYEVTVKVGASASYYAMAREIKDVALEARSEPATVLAKVHVFARTRSLKPERRSKIEITAQIQPRHDGSTAKLERKKDETWKTVMSDKADRSGFSFKLKAFWKGKRVFRVTWVKSDEDHEPASSNRLKIKTVKPVERDGGRRRG